VKQTHGLETELAATSIAAVQIEILIVSLSRGVQLLDGEIEAEEERTRCMDRRDPSYSILARTMIARRDNLSATIAALRERWAALDNTACLSEPRWNYS